MWIFLLLPTQLLKQVNLRNYRTPWIQVQKQPSEANPEPTQKQYPTRNQQAVDRYDPSFT